MCVEVVRIDLEAATVCGLGLCRLAHCLQHISQVVIALGVVRLEPNGHLQLLEALVGIPQLKRGNTAEVQGLRIFRLECEDLLAQPLCVLEQTGPQAGESLLKQLVCALRGACPGRTIATACAWRARELVETTSFFTVHGFQAVWPFCPIPILPFPSPSNPSPSAPGLPRHARETQTVLLAGGA